MHLLKSSHTPLFCNAQALDDHTMTRTNLCTGADRWDYDARASACSDTWLATRLDQNWRDAETRIRPPLPVVTARMQTPYIYSRPCTVPGRLCLSTQNREHYDTLSSQNT